VVTAKRNVTGSTWKTSDRASGRRPSQQKDNERSESSTSWPQDDCGSRRKTKKRRKRM